MNIPYFNLDQVYNSKQVPRWIKLRENKYVISNGNKAIKVEQKGDLFLFGCTEKDFFDIWFNYFDLGRDYLEINRKANRLVKKLKLTVSEGMGIHLIKQDAFEAFIYSELVYSMGYDKAKKAMNHISEKCGNKHINSMGEMSKITWYEFPTAEQILENKSKLKRMGKVNSWLENICDEIVNKHFSYTLTDKKLYKLFTGSEINEFPTVDIEDLILTNFDLSGIYEFVEAYLEDFEEKGLIYLYILHYKSKRLEELKMAVKSWE